ncbi:PPC domain-containing DNA-binding protein [Leptolyngbya sp. FACHB-261]|uniref:PPC domain-containing DNA-binding protein n=1 Tax=Leptolyngbya sp. FACHB-261 TaxID=2692806 RepID=UPI001689BC6A|nr:PPC domain-containing DNA-binding protein [Leptolyngbya sp. FACHB-261]MBD2104736.1 DNA-binding protein [Leptolyngbya sp. FACHB-261]
MKTLALRLRPGQDLMQALGEFANEQQLQAGFILTCVGSLNRAALRFAGQPTATLLEDRFEIVSLVGTLSVHGLHLHLSLADSTGRTIGGHVKQGCRIYTTAELVIGELEHCVFERAPDPDTSYLELQIRNLEFQD